MRIHKEESIGLIIDVQEKLFPHIYRHDMIGRNLEILIKGLKIFNIPLLVTEQYRKGLGFTIPAIDALIDDYQAIEKMSFSCCDNEDFQKKLTGSGKKYVIMGGIETHVCILQTVVDLIDKGFQPVVVEDCTSSRKENDKIIAIERMRQEGALITTYESLLFELARISGTELFKSVSRLVK